MQLRNRIRVLIVDDCAATRITLRAILNNNQYEVIGELNDGKKLDSTIAKLHPQIICLDHLLPEKDGLTLLSEIRAAYPHISVVMITGSDDITVRHNAAMLGAAGFICKPFSQKQVIEVLQADAHTEDMLMIAAKQVNPFADQPYHARAVIADDSLTMRRLLTNILAHMGVEVIGEAYDGKQAVELVSEHRPDIACLDFEMPVMNGLEALKIIHHQNAATKVIMITALASRELFTQATNAGAKGYIIKPFHPDRVTQSVSRILAS